MLDDSQVNISTIAGSRYAGPIKERVADMQRQLNLFSDTLDEWLECQKNWLYLESIFSAPDIQRQLPREAVLFLEVDKAFKEAMRRTAAFPNALRAGCTPGFLDIFQRNNKSLEIILKCLEVKFPGVSWVYVWDITYYVGSPGVKNASSLLLLASHILACKTNT